MTSWGVFFVCFFFSIVVCDDREIVWRFFDASAYPRPEFKVTTVGLTVRSFNLMANLHLSLLLGFDGSETVHPPSFSSRGFLDVDFIFLIQFVVIHIFNVVVDQTHFLCVRFSPETYYCLFCTWVSLDISKQLRGSRPSPAAHQNTCAASRCK